MTLAEKNATRVKSPSLQVLRRWSQTLRSLKFAIIFPSYMKPTIECLLISSTKIDIDKPRGKSLFFERLFEFIAIN